MKTLNYLLFLNILLLTFSCKCQNYIREENALKVCVNDAVNRDIKLRNGKEPFDFYNLIENFENEMIKGKYLKNVNKKKYKKLFLDISSNNYRNLYDKLNKLSDSIGFDYNSYSITQSILTKCPYEVFFRDEKTEHNFIKNQIIIINRLEAQGYNNQELLKQLVENIDNKSFKKIIYRAPLILIALINLDMQYNTIIKR
jgi:hypothetical protein